VIILDTHTWVWWVSNPEKLSAPARERIEKAVINKDIFISSISAWEAAMLTARGRLKLTMDVRDWIAKSEALPFLRFIPVTNQFICPASCIPTLRTGSLLPRLSFRKLPLLQRMKRFLAIPMLRRFGSGVIFACLRILQCHSI